jgi:hypothetical protein
MRLFLLRGRSERRIPVRLPVYLARVSLLAETELAVAVNAGQHGLRVITRRHWRPGEVLIVTSLSNEPRITAKVAYCWRRLEHTYDTGLQVETAAPRWWEEFSPDRSSAGKRAVPTASPDQKQ